MRRPRLINVGLAAAILATGVGTYLAVDSGASTKSNPSTVDVSTGTVLASVSASGTVVPSQQVGLNFLSNGVVLEVDVKVGDHVSAGQVLAKIDPTNAQNSLTEAQAQLTAAQDNLAALQTASTTTSTTPTTTSTNDPASSSGAPTSQQLSTAQANLQRDSAKLQAAQGLLSSAQASFQQATAKVNHDLAFSQQCVANPATPPSGGLTCATVATQLQIDTAAQASAQAAVVAAGVNVTTAQQGVAADQAAVAAATAASTTSKSSGSSASSSASSSGGSSGSSGSSGGSSSGSIAQAQATVTSDQIAVDNAQKALDATTMTAPSDGTVSALSGAVGQTVTAGSSAASTGSSNGNGSSTGASTGSSTGNGSTAASSSSASSASSTSSSSSSSFLTLTNLNALQVEAGFTEADATKLVVGQKVVATFSALPNDQVQGEVAQVAVTATTSNGVVSYTALINLDQVPSGLKPGMTATAQVVVGEADNAVFVPASAVTGTGTTGTVTVVASDGTETVTPVTVGLRGDMTIEITSGVKAGDKVLRSTVAASAAATTGGTGRTGAGAGGGLTGTGGIGGAGAGGGAGRLGGGPTG